MGAGAEADIGTGEPVAQVVAGLTAGFGKVGDLILGITRPFQPPHCPQVEIGLHIVIGEDFPLLHPFGQRGAILHLQPIAGQVLGNEGEGVLHALLPAFLCREYP